MKRNRSGTGWNWSLARNSATVSAAVFFSPVMACFSQSPQPDVQGQVRLLSEAMNRIQSQIDESQRELSDLKRQLAVLQGSTGAPAEAPREQPSDADVVDLASAVAGMRESQAIHETQIATLEQTKVESESKYPLKISGLILMTGSVNTQRVDSAVTPAIAINGAGSTAATVRQTILGLDASGPHLFAASSHAELRLDCDGDTGGPGYGESSVLGTLRLRTAHAELVWQHTKSYFALDRPLISPNAPASVTAVAQPPLAWSGNLWTWNPQVGASHDFASERAARLHVEGALIDVGDPPALYPPQRNGTYTAPNTAELSRWPGVEARVALATGDIERGPHLGMSGYFAPHRVPGYANFNSWAGALDFSFPVTGWTQVTGGAYRGQALGGMGGGAYKDFVARTYEGELYFRALDDSGGWVQWKQRRGERLEFNEAFGVDNVPAHQLRFFAINNADSYYNLARNRTITGNVIYSPSAYLLFSLEYRRIASSFVNSPTEFSDVIGLAAGYKF